MSDFEHVFEQPPEGAAADWTIPQNWSAYTEVEHQTWNTLYERQMKILPGRACEAFMRGLDALDRAVTKFEKWDPKTNMGQRIQPDPAAPVADKGADAAIPAAPAVPTVQPANTATQPAADVAPNPDSRRRISGVRRTDTKDL